ncbi:MAG: hypothetical protein QF704_02740 [Anaerolineales bacterium]|nr:hypothetical protein [Anaerolineales bacterium]
MVIDDFTGYPEGYDPATGQKWVNSAGEWYVDEDGDPREPLYD